MLSELSLASLQALDMPRDGLSQAADIAMVTVGVAVVVTSLVVTFFVVRLNRIVAELRSGVKLTLGPVSDRARRVTDNVEFITQALRSDVEQLTGSVQALTKRLHQASAHMEERIEEFNALMKVVQSEAEDIFLDTAATVRGVREGARRITTPEPTPPATPVDPVPSERSGAED